MVAFLLLSRPQLRIDSPARAPLPSEVPNPIVTIETSKMTLALEDGSKYTTSASKVLPSAAASRVSTTAASGSLGSGPHPAKWVLSIPGF